MTDTDEFAAPRCSVERCINAEQPPENWASCFYDGSPCQTAKPEQIGRFVGLDGGVHEDTGETAEPRTGFTPCDWPDCPRTVVDGWALFRVNPTGQRGVFMCSEHAGASPEEVADLMDAVAAKVPQIGSSAHPEEAS